MEDAGPLVGEEDLPEATTYRVYKRRWAMMLTVMVLNLSNEGMGFNLAAVAYKAADFFEVTQQQITWFTQVYFIVPILLSYVSTFIFNKYDMKVGIHIGSVLNCVGAVMRAVATSGFINDPWAQFVFSLVGQVVAATGQLFIAFIITKVTQNWFPDEGRMMATAIMSFFPPLGISMAQVMAPLLVTSKQHIPTLNNVYCGIALFGEFVTLVCVTRSRPPTPPSRSAEEGKRTRAPYLQQLKDTFTCLPFLGLLIMTGIITGFFLCVTTLSQQMLCSIGYSDLFSGAVVTIFIVAGFVGSIPVAVVANRTNALTPITKLVNGLGVVFAIFMMEIYLMPRQHILLITSSTLFGLFGCGMYPISLEMGVETTYPVEETISTTLIYVVSQVLGVVMTYAANMLSSDLPPRLEDVEVCTEDITSDLHARDYTVVITGLMAVLTVTVVLFTLLFRTPYKRRDAEATDVHARATSPSTFTRSPAAAQGLW